MEPLAQHFGDMFKIKIDERIVCPTFLLPYCSTNGAYHMGEENLTQTIISSILIITECELLNPVRTHGFSVRRRRRPIVESGKLYHQQNVKSKIRERADHSRHVT